MSSSKTGMDADREISSPENAVNTAGSVNTVDSEAASRGHPDAAGQEPAAKPKRVKSTGFTHTFPTFTDQIKA
eukprot:COSAG01_NODE_45485_length_409_cov_0.664516_1_plen_72_part_01